MTIFGRNLKITIFNFLGTLSKADQLNEQLNSAIHQPDCDLPECSSTQKSIVHYKLEALGGQMNRSSNKEKRGTFTILPASPTLLCGRNSQNTFCQSENPSRLCCKYDEVPAETMLSCHLLSFEGRHNKKRLQQIETVNTRCVVDGRSSSRRRPTLGRRVGRRQLQAVLTAANTRAQLLPIYPTLLKS